MKKNYVDKSILLEKIDGVLERIWESLDEEHKEALIKANKKSQENFNYEEEG